MVQCGGELGAGASWAGGVARGVAGAARGKGGCWLLGRRCLASMMRGGSSACRCAYLRCASFISKGQCFLQSLAL